MMFAATSSEAQVQNRNSHRDDRAARLLDPEVIAQLETIRRAVPGPSHTQGRFDFYGYLSAVYQTHGLWKRDSVAKKTARKLAAAFDIPLRAGISPLRVLIEATFAEATAKQKSRWVRALEHAHEEHITAERLVPFLKSNGGIAGCAALAAHDDPKKRTDRDDWGLNPRPARILL
jgi:hypothetical protein